MSFATVAKKDFQDSARSRWLWGLTVLFVLFAGGAAYLYGGTDLFVSEGGTRTTQGFIGLLAGAAGLLVPVIALLAGHKAIVGERESGSLKLLLSLPHTRKDAVIGKFIGRTGVVTASILIGFLVATVLGAVLFGQFDPLEFIAFTGITVLLAFAYISISMGLSAATASASRAAAIAFGFWLVFEFLWGIIGFGLLWATNGFSLGGLGENGLPEWYFLFLRLSPSSAYSTSVQALFEGQSIINTATFGGTTVTNNPLGEGATVPLFLEDWFALIILAIWIVVPVTLGYLRFESTDL